MQASDHSGVFNFAAWVKQYELDEIKSLLEEMSMCSLESLSTDNPNFLKLMCDDRFIDKSHLMRNIIDGINALKDKHTLTVSYKQRINIENQLQDLDNVCNEQQLFDDYQFQRQEQLENLNKLKQLRENEIDEMKQQIDDEFIKIYGMLRSKKTSLAQKINAFKNTLNEFIEYKRKEIKQFDIKMSKFCSQKSETKQHYQKQLNLSLDLDPENGAKLLEIKKNYAEIHKFMNMANIAPDTEYKLDLIQSAERFTELRENIRNCMFIKSFDETLNLRPSKTAQIRKMKTHKKTLLDENMRLKVSQQALKAKVNQQQKKLKMVQNTLNIQLFNKPKTNKKNQNRARDDQKNDEEVKNIRKFGGYRTRIDPMTHGPSQAATEWRRMQIDIGKNSMGYQNLVKLCPGYTKNKKKGWKLDIDMIEQPKIDAKCGKKRWVGRYKKWRQFLHEFDNIDDVESKMKK